MTLVSGFGALPLVLAGSTHADSQYATTPTSAGAVNPEAIPLGDGYVSSTPRVGYVDSCITSFNPNAGGSQVAGPWIDQRGKTWNYTTKLTVSGDVSWPNASYRVTQHGQTRLIRFNDLPINHTTGRFPIASTDPAHQYDMNPNHIAAHELTWTVALNPTAVKHPSCTKGGAIGVLKDGVVLYNALDGEGRDAGAHEVLDLCAGHPDQSSTYHHHDVPPCILRAAPNGTSTLVGYALDGYGIYVQKAANGVMPTNVDLDACHGTTSKVKWNGEVQRVYHYVATLEYPYAIGCFHGKVAGGQGGQGGQGGPPSGGQGGSGPPGGGSGGPPGGGGGGA